MVTKRERYEFDKYCGPACGNPEKVARRSKILSQIWADFETEHGRPPRKGEVFKWLNEEEG